MLVSRCKLVWLLFLFIGVPAKTLCQQENYKEEAALFYQKGKQYFIQENYKEAAALTEKAVALHPNNARYYHLLGKSYARLAQQSSWFSAIRLARKTLRAFEKAAELEPDNIDILSDLMEYYQKAPSFLGGHAKKARQIEEKVLQLKQSRQAL